jgi:hypothetical protein
MLVLVVIDLITEALIREAVTKVKSNLVKEQLRLKLNQVQKMYKNKYVKH